MKIEVGVQGGKRDSLLRVTCNRTLRAALRFSLTTGGATMKKYFVIAIAASVAFAASAQPAKDIFADIAGQIKGPLGKLTALEADEKKLAVSEQAQIFASAQEKKDRARIEREKTALQLDGQQSDQMRQRIIDMGCPEKGGVAPIDLVNRCNPQVAAHAALVARLMERLKSLVSQQQSVDELRASISNAVLENVRKRKAIDADRATYTAERNRLQSLAIAAVIDRNKLGAARACKSACCHKMIYDGADPNLCGLGLVCQSFQSAGLFGGKNPICVVAQTPRAIQVR